jgi:hypothetical protein
MVEVQETVAVPEPVMLLGEIELQLSPLGTVSVREIIPVKPFSAVSVIVDIWDCTVLVGAGEDAMIEKSAPDGTVTSTAVVWERVRLVPVTVTL